MCSFSSNYRPFCSRWWRHWLRPRTYTHPFVFAYQRVFRGWADCDTWNVDSWLSSIIPPAIEHLRDTTHGYPHGLSEVEWHAILTRIADGFRAAQDSKEMPDRFITELSTSTGMWSRFGWNDREYDFEGYEAYQKEELAKFKKAMKLFTKHYLSLWD